ncbi:albumin-1 D-like [Vicia villosa]|uniref:albumin-1 D-like n=1 Tax=Vicia villosa TaxID=3911 RepID=UPI00273B058B|nr:albumin-1 D-like [Vicia villosa]
MASVKFASMGVLMLAIFCMVMTKNVGACPPLCSPLEWTPCGSSDCRCFLFAPFTGYCTSAGTKSVEEHPNVCQFHVDCTEKKTGTFCARYPNPNIKHGWCFASKSEAEDVLFKFFSNYNVANGLENIAIA